MFINTHFCTNVANIGISLYLTFSKKCWPTFEAFGYSTESGIYTAFKATALKWTLNFLMVFEMSTPKVGKIFSNLTGFKKITKLTAKLGFKLASTNPSGCCFSVAV